MAPDEPFLVPVVIDDTPPYDSVVPDRFRSAHAFVDYFRTYYGPTVKAFEAAGSEDGDALFADLADLVRRHAGKSTGPLTIPATWLETVAIRSTA